MNFKPQELKATLFHEIAKRHDAVMDPDHPYLVDGPDILAAGNGGIVGVFVMRSSEVRHPGDLLCRMTVSRIVYPTNFEPVLVIPPNISEFTPQVTQLLESNFGRVLNWGNRSYLSGVLNDNIQIHPGSQSLDVLRQETFFKARTLYSASLGEIADSEGKVAPSGEEITHHQVPRMSMKQRPWSVDVLIADQRMSEPPGSTHLTIRSASLQTSGLVRSRLTQFGRFVFESDHKLDHGIPYRRRDSLNILLADYIPVHRTDPNKWLRSASVSGFAVLLNEGPDHVGVKIHALQRQLRELHEKAN